jgi:thiol peroxidase
LSRKVTSKGSPFELLGDEIKVGQKAPEFKAIAKDLSEISSSQYRGKVRIIASVPSLDTPVCDLELNRFNEFALNGLKDAHILFVSMDLPFAQKRFCDLKNIDRVLTFSDHRDADFGMKYGVLIKDLRLLARAVFIVDRDDTVRHAEYVPELGAHPDYKKALAVIQALK